MYTMRVKSHFDAAHYLQDYEGACHRHHGHRWEVEVVCTGKRLDSRNILVDFKDIKKVLEAVLKRQLDHYQLNETLAEPNPTAEYLAEWLFNTLEQQCDFEFPQVSLTQVIVWESPECSITFSREV